MPSAGTVTVIVKNRFKHSRTPCLGNGTPSKKQKTGLELLSESYKESNSSSNSPGSQSHPGPATVVRTTGASTGVSQPTAPSLTTQQRTVSLCSGCKSTETYHIANGLYKCRNCNRNYVPLSRLHSAAVQTAVTTAILPATTFYGSSSSGTGSQSALLAKRTTVVDGVEGKRTSPRKKKQLETIDLISSDEDEDQNTSNNHVETETKDTATSTRTPVTQTPQSTTVNNSSIAERMKLPGGGTGVNKENKPTPNPSPSPATSQETPSSEYTFHCNKVMFGELYGQSVAPTRVSDNRMYLSLECLIVRENIQASEKYTLSVGSNDVEEISVYFGRIPSFIAIKTASKFASVACKRIGKDVLIPSAEDVKKRYIILALTSAFKNDNEADAERRSLVTAVSPWAKINILSHAEATVLIEKVKLDVNQREVCQGKRVKSLGPVETLLIYPPSLKSGGIPITTLDVACLDEGTYLNDVIIDFYLKYLYEGVMSKEQREKTYIFNSYFYKRLTLKSGSKFSPSVMHAQVKKWTRNVDIFQKDFIIIPVNEHCHWYLVIVCFPSSTYNIEDFNEKEEEEEEEDAPDFIMKEVESSDGKRENSPDTASDITEAPELSATPPPTSTERSQSPTTETSMRESETSKLDEPKSENTGSNGNSNETSVGTENKGAKLPTQAANTASAPPTQTFKQATDMDEFVRPCILIFDSLVGSGHSRVFTNLRHYLTQEWLNRKPKETPRIFDKETMKGCYPKVPRQNNDCDCGVFILQYAEHFFTKPVKNFRMPIHLESWFTVDSVTKKRDDIKDLINMLSENDKKSAMGTSTNNTKNKK